MKKMKKNYSAPIVYIEELKFETISTACAKKFTDEPGTYPASPIPGFENHTVFASEANGCLYIVNTYDQAAAWLGEDALCYQNSNDADKIFAS